MLNKRYPKAKASCMPTRDKHRKERKILLWPTNKIRSKRRAAVQPSRLKWKECNPIKFKKRRTSVTAVSLRNIKILNELNWFLRHKGHRTVSCYSHCPFSHTQYTYLLTPWCRVLLEKLTGLQQVKKFPAFHGTRRFITALTSVRHLSLSWASPHTHILPPGDPS